MVVICFFYMRRFAYRETAFILVVIPIKVIRGSGDPPHKRIGMYIRFLLVCSKLDSEHGNNSNVKYELQSLL